MRIGQGFDAHRFGEGRKLILGGVEIPHSHGMLAHSDGDVLVHAVCDALLGAGALGDLGRHFPDSEDDYAGIDSRLLLRRTVELLNGHRLEPVNLDATIVAQRPRLAGFIPAMRENLAADLGLPAERVSIKATTTEGMGFTGRGEGIAAFAIVLVTDC